MRAFLALRPDEDALAALSRCVKTLQGALAGARIAWVPAAQQHVTLKFFADLDDATFPRVVARLGSACAAFAPAEALQMAVRALGALPSPQRPRAIYAGLAGPDGGAPLALLRLAACVEDALAELGIPREGRPFLPHLTLGRVREPPRGDRLAAALARFQGQAFGAAAPLEAVLLYESRLAPGGPTYIERARLPLGGP